MALLGQLANQAGAVTCAACGRPTVPPSELPDEELRERYAHLSECCTGCNLHPDACTCEPL